MTAITLTPPYLIFLGRETRESYAKTGAGLNQWRPELCKGQIRLEGGTVDLGLPEMTLEDAQKAGIKTLVIGTAAVGGSIPDEWVDLLVEAAERGLHIVGGVHTPLNNIERLKHAATLSGSELIDVRTPPKHLPVGTGRKRTGKRLLTVGTDCALGKKYTALALERDMKNAGINATFRASGQTGIMIAGTGLPIDSVVADFVSGAAELLSPDNTDDHWDIIEGQGSIYHPGYASVSMGLLMGSQPDAFVVCTEAGRTHIEGWPDFPLPTIQDVIDRTIDIGKQFNPAIHCVGISVNTSPLPSAERQPYLDRLSAEYGLPCVDSILTGTDAIAKKLKKEG
ncbi:hypothetical protein GCM10017044_25250 [Kordiimonas sediminis]|uniref:DUF1611 domain-containing protein n=1 Tax=Kordiimonas sediminis TaxID=1735581 RepID=A0A919AY13_9PROT|nr:DUF1611 domain-containing protein [Kordiimonas sediminis]GHF28951.1 hypothetical protein GCM10017044_25250 [Kordiimonas sediminis]